MYVYYYYYYFGKDTMIVDKSSFAGFLDAFSYLTVCMKSPDDVCVSLQVSMTASSAFSVTVD
jgi:hypothetical protein